MYVAVLSVFSLFLEVLVSGINNHEFAMVS